MLGAAISGGKRCRRGMRRIDQYMGHLSSGLGHLDRHARFKGYCTGLMLPLARKSVEPMAARVDPMHTSARYQAYITSWPRRTGPITRCCVRSVIGSCRRWTSAGAVGGSSTTRGSRRRASTRGSGLAILRDAGHPGQLPCRDEHVAGVRTGQRAAGVATRLTRGLGRGSGAQTMAQRTRGLALRHEVDYQCQGRPGQCDAGQGGLGGRHRIVTEQSGALHWTVQDTVW